MNDENASSKESENVARKQLGTIFQPKNLLKTVASQFPFASAGVEMLNQIEGEKIDGRLKNLEGTDAELIVKLRKLEQAAPTTPPPINDWPAVVSEYVKRIIDFAVVYDDGNDRELIQVVAHGCIVDENKVLTCSEAFEMAKAVAQYRRGNVIMLSGLAWYEFNAEAPNNASGLLLCQITGRNEEKWNEWNKLHEKYELGPLVHKPNMTPIKYSVSPWMGQEIGFLHSGEATGAMTLDRFSNLQFDTSVISHFKSPRDGAVKAFVTDVLPGRILWTGSPVFNRQGTLLGVIASTENYKSDAGRRAVIKSLLGHPHFMKRK
jgi:hypothetical protein